MVLHNHVLWYEMQSIRPLFRVLLSKLLTISERCCKTVYTQMLLEIWVDHFYNPLRNAMPLLFTFPNLMESRTESNLK